MEVFFIIVLSIWLFGLIAKWMLRRWIAKKQREFTERFGGGAQFRGSGSGSARRNDNKEGEVSVQQTTPVEKKVNKVVGDYVEFEEVEVVEEINCKE